MTHNLTKRETSRKTLQEKFTDYGRTIVQWNSGINAIVDETQYLNTRIEVEEMLLAIFEYFTIYTEQPSEWELKDYHDFVDIIYLFAQNKKSGIEIQLGLSKNGLYLDMRIKNEDKIHLMNDAFYSQLLDLNKLGELKFQPDEVLGNNTTEEYKTLFKDKSSQLFMLLRNLISYEIITGHTISLGTISLRWPFDAYSIKDVIDNGPQAMIQLNQLNLLLANAK